MAGLTVTTKLTDLKTLFNDVKEIYFKSSEIKVADLNKSFTADMELPVLEEGVSFNTGDADVTEIKLTTGSTWVSKATKGDSDISFQVASIAGPVNSLLMNKVGTDITSTEGILVDGVTYAGAAYSLAPKKVAGSLLMFSEDRQTIIALPNVEMYASLVAADGDNPAYFNVAVSPLENSEGADIMILWKTIGG
nr:MAG TPA: hypothetical protein [Caudoviricetes sp.]